ncbi:hypothetical protein A946_08540 [Methylacidiphilum kamchatkense Kam1]|uniref:Uncharacterized protein n=1 Tax=Methylacidiphilum kamchatkense Kam1 TaxID=1202785 RepID=A0A0C1RTB3_9BACT|nr:hypothetical protein A946_08540 [Methylacidiphilum kamchatkense Kam1]QDQ42081.1 hypothetical protein kam1_838 [Methylacidiphilum kamchatkense Kam1]
MTALAKFFLPIQFIFPGLRNERCILESKLFILLLWLSHLDFIAEQKLVVLFSIASLFLPYFGLLIRMYSILMQKFSGSLLYAKDNVIVVEILNDLFAGKKQ